MSVSDWRVGGPCNNIFHATAYLDQHLIVGENLLQDTVAILNVLEFLCLRISCRAADVFCSGFKAEGEVFDHQRPVSEFKAKALWIVEPVFALSVPVISMCESDRTWLSIASNREYIAKHSIAQSSVFCVHIKPVAAGI